VALKAPFADVSVCSLTVHLKSVQVLGVGISWDDVQLPRSALLPAAVGAVSEFLCSKPHADPVAAASDNTITKSRCLMCLSSYGIGQRGPGEQLSGRPAVYHRKSRATELDGIERISLRVRLPTSTG
jgi:hypothetical protein